jgi:hypothetical protein
VLINTPSCKKLLKHTTQKLEYQTGIAKINHMFQPEGQEETPQASPKPTNKLLAKSGSTFSLFGSFEKKK